MKVLKKKLVLNDSDWRVFNSAMDNLRFLLSSAKRLTLDGDALDAMKELEAQVTVGETFSCIARSERP